MKKLYLLFIVALCAACSKQEKAPAEQKPAPTPGKVYLTNPPEVVSKNGRLETTLTAGPAKITVAGKTFTSNVYNGSYLAPTLRMTQDDSVIIHLVNNLKDVDQSTDSALIVPMCAGVFKNETNLHFHGMGIPPQKPGDFIYMGVPAEAGKNEFTYRFKVPHDHPKGEHWYHPHRCGFVESQVLSGMSGAIIVEGLVENHYPELAGMKEGLRKS